MGFESNTDLASLAALERKVRQIVQDLGRKAAANPVNLAGASVRRTGTRPPSITGLALVSKVDRIVVKWNRAPIEDLKRYEIQVADNEAFTSPTTRNTRDTEWTYEEGDVDTTYYIRVRAINNSDQNGEYSGVLNTQTAKVGTTNIATAAAGALPKLVQTVTGVIVGDDSTGSTIPGTDVATWDSDRLAVTVSGTEELIVPRVLITAGLQAQFAGTAVAAHDNTNRLVIDVIRVPFGGVNPEETVATATIDVKSTIPVVIDFAAPDVFAPRLTDWNEGELASFSSQDADVPAGQYEYFVRITAEATQATNGSCYVRVRVDEIILEFWQLKR